MSNARFITKKWQEGFLLQNKYVSVVLKVSMMIYILGEDVKRFLPIVQTFQKHHVPFRIIHAGEAGMDLSIDPQRFQGCILYNRTSPSARVRGFKGAIDFARSILDLFRAQGVSKIVHDTSALDLEGSKAAQVIACLRFGLDVPQTYIAHGKDALFEIAIQKLRLPRSAVLASMSGPGNKQAWYVKADRGGSSHDVVRCTSLKNVMTAAERTDSPSMIWVVQREVMGRYALSVSLTREQQEIRARGAFDAAATKFHIKRTHYRLEIIDHKVLYVLRVQSTGMTRDLCPCADDKNAVGTSFEITDDEVQRIVGKDRWFAFVDGCLDLTREYQIFAASFEFALGYVGYEDQSQPPKMYVFDIACGNTNYNEAAELRARLPPTRRGYEVIASYLMEQLETFQKVKQDDVISI